jgi:hypothetical protein
VAFHDRKYVAYVVLGNSDAEPLWNWRRWSEFAAAFDPVVNQCRDKAVVRCHQYSRETRKPVKFGRLTWNAASHQKWAHESPHTEAESRAWIFQSIQVSAPSFPISARDGIPPDLFLTVRNEASLFGGTQLAFNPLIFVAVAADMPAGVLGQCRIAVEKVELMIRSRLSATIVRPWGYPFGSDGAFTRAIQDLSTTGLFKIGPTHKRPVDLTTFEEQWKFFG